MKGEVDWKALILSVIFAVIIVTILFGGFISGEVKCHQEGYGYADHFSGNSVKCCREIINEDRTGFDEICEVFEI